MGPGPLLFINGCYAGWPDHFIPEINRDYDCVVRHILGQFIYYYIFILTKTVVCERFTVEEIQHSV